MDPTYMPAGLAGTMVSPAGYGALTQQGVGGNPYFYANPNSAALTGYTTTGPGWTLANQFAGVNFPWGQPGYPANPGPVTPGPNQPGAQQWYTNAEGKQRYGVPPTPRPTTRTGTEHGTTPTPTPAPLDPGQMLRSYDVPLGPFGQEVGPVAQYTLPPPSTNAPPPPSTNMQWSDNRWTAPQPTGGLTQQPEAHLQTPSQPTPAQTSQQAGTGPFATKRGGTVNRFAAGGIWADGLFQPPPPSGWDPAGSYFRRSWPDPIRQSQPQPVGGGYAEGGKVPKTAYSFEPSDPATFVPIVPTRTPDVPATTPDYLRVMELMHRNRMRAQGIR